MQRRELIRILGGMSVGGALAGLSPDELFARGIATHRRASRAIGPFTPAQTATLTRAAEIIMPGTETPGATEAGVPEFIAVIVGEWDTREDRERFIQGLDSLDAKARERFGKSFVDGSEAQQAGVLTELDNEMQTYRAQHKNTDQLFYPRLKGLTLYGYYTSEVGMTQELQNQVIPGRFDGCAPVTAWRPR
jgi:hypothetical protein